METPAEHSFRQFIQERPWLISPEFGVSKRSSAKRSRSNLIGISPSGGGEVMIRVAALVLPATPLSSPRQTGRVNWDGLIR